MKTPEEMSTEELKAEIKKFEEETKAARQREEVTAFHDGFRFKTTMWIHPMSGDDYESSYYSETPISTAKISSYLRNSEVKDDFIVKRLTRGGAE